jgi:hypothetical protein
MNKKIVSRFLMLGMLVCMLAFGINSVSASATSDFNDCMNACGLNYSNCGFNIGPFSFKPPWCGLNEIRCNAACIDAYNVAIHTQAPH